MAKSWRDWKPLVTAAAVFGGSCAAIVALYRASHALYNQYDDAYITYRYAVHLARGNGLVYNVGERADSASSFLHVVVLGLLYKLGLHDLEAVATWLGVAFTGAAATLVYLSIRETCKSELVGGLIGLLTAVHGFMSGWAVSGMDTPLFAFAVALFAHCFFLKRERIAWSCCALILVVLTRVEGAILVIAAGLSVLVEWKKRRPPAAALMTLAPAVAAGLALVVFRLAYYGRALPHAFYFKRIWSTYQSRPAELLGSWQSTAAIATLLAVGGLALLPDRRSRVGVGSYLVLSAISLYLGPRSGWARYSVHLFPLVMVLAGLAVIHVWRNARLLAFSLLAALGWQTCDSALEMRKFLERTSYHQQCRKEVGRHLQQLGSDHPVLSSDIGAIAYVAMDVSFIDAIGLTSPDVLAAYESGGSLEPLFDSQRPLLVADTWYKKRKTHQALTVLSRPSAYIKERVAPPAYLRTLTDGPALKSCDTPDGFVISLAPLVPREPAGGKHRRTARRW